jgi:DNA-binding transcriptional LysR family regulator
VSVAIAQLERELRVPLLMRSRDGVQATPAGLAVIEVARRVVRDAELAAAVARAAMESRQRVRVAMVDQVGAPALAAGVVAAASAGIELEFVWGHRPWDVECLFEDGCDAAVVAAPVARSGVRTAVLYVEPRGIMVGPSSELFEAGTEDVTLDLLSGHPSVDAIGLPDRWMDEWSYATQMNGQRVRRIGPRVDSVNTTLISVMTTPAMAFVPRALGLVGASFGLRYLEVSQGPPCTHLLAWREPADAATQLFITAATSSATARP